MRSAEPLTEEQRFLLNNLPNESDAPEFSPGDPEFPPHFVLRDIVYERLCTSGKVCTLQRSREKQFNLPDRTFVSSIVSGHCCIWSVCVLAQPIIRCHVTEYSFSLSKAKPIACSELKPSRSQRA